MPQYELEEQLEEQFHSLTDTLQAETGSEVAHAPPSAQMYLRSQMSKGWTVPNKK
jgi:hypothetical protein